ncbi:VOC family protein [Subtercola sp. Z020]|uniref:VOC family protein n=1 Tax=Subtercola sp. Z020 TaxID=2080582 RepID=UPI00130D8CDD|nr:VOC family protein [Subtercola sp. Z020]
MDETTERASTPRLRQVVLDTENARGLAEFYRRLLGLRYLPGDEPVWVADAGGVDAGGADAGGADAGGADAGAADTGAAGDDADWLVLVGDDGERVLAFQKVASMPRPTWPEGPRPQMMHLDFWVPSVDALRQQHERALSLGATVLENGIDDPDEAIVIYADPAGHPLCIFVP